MKRIFRLFLIPALALALVSCSKDRAAVDAKLSKACVAIINGVYNDPEDTLEIKDTVFQSDKTPDKVNLRVVRLHAIYTHDHGILQEKDYACAFEEVSGLFGYKPSFYNADVDGQKFGTFDGTMQGDLNMLLKINDIAQPLLE